MCMTPALLMSTFSFGYSAINLVGDRFDACRIVDIQFHGFHAGIGFGRFGQMALATT